MLTLVPVMLFLKVLLYVVDIPPTKQEQTLLLTMLLLIILPTLASLMRMVIMKIIPSYVSVPGLQIKSRTLIFIQTSRLVNFGDVGLPMEEEQSEVTTMAI